VKFARIVFTGAGIWGIVVLTPFYRLVDITGRHYSAPTEYPQFFYGFFAVALAWQMTFLMIGWRPGPLRALMIPSIAEKFGWVATLAVLYGQGRIPAIDAQAALPDGLLGILFVVAFAKTSRPSHSRNTEIAPPRAGTRQSHGGEL